MKIKYGVMLVFTMFMMTVFCMQATAHNVWINPGNHFPQVGETVDIGVGWGHSYPAVREDQKMKDGQLKEIIAVDPDGLQVKLLKVSTALYQLKVEKAGAYVITAKVDSGFFTMTPEGRKWGDKKKVTNGVKCTNYHIGAKTVLIAGGKAKNLGHVSGQTLELIPLTDPGTLEKGKPFSFKILFDGKPVSGLSINAKYAGFDEKKEKTGENEIKKGKEDKKAPKKNENRKRKPYPCEAKTDDAGVATITPTQPGYWMVSYSNTSVYPDESVCDECRYSMAFTLEVK